MQLDSFRPLTSLIKEGKFVLPNLVFCRLLKLLESTLLFNFLTISSFSLFVTASPKNDNGMISSKRYQRWWLSAFQRRHSLIFQPADFPTKAFTFSSYQDTCFKKVMSWSGTEATTGAVIHHGM